MNKLKSILCSMLLFVVCAVMCVGCSVNFSGSIDENGNGSGSGTTIPENPEESDDQTKPGTYKIALSDTEDIILDALFLDWILLDGTNRDVYEKFGTFLFNSTEVVTGTEHNELIGASTTNAVINYCDGLYKKGNYNFSRSYTNGGNDVMVYHLNNLDYYWYSDYAGDNSIEYNKGRVEEGEKFDSFSHQDLAMKQVFSEKWFSLIYGDQAEKIVKEDGFTICLKNGLKGCMYLNQYLGGDAYDDFSEYEAKLKEQYDQELIDDCFIKVEVEFDKNGKITKVKFEAVLLNAGATLVKDHWTMSIEPSDIEIREPEWVRDNY